MLSDFLLHISSGGVEEACLLLGKPPFVHFQSTQVFTHVYIEVSEVHALDGGVTAQYTRSCIFFLVLSRK